MTSATSCICFQHFQPCEHGWSFQVLTISQSGTFHLFGFLLVVALDFGLLKLLFVESFGTTPQINSVHCKLLWNCENVCIPQLNPSLSPLLSGLFTFAIMSIGPFAIITYLMDKKLLDSKIQNEDQTFLNRVWFCCCAVLLLSDCELAARVKGQKVWVVYRW